MALAGSSLLPRWSQQDWSEVAACRGRTDLFFPPQAERPQARARREAQAAALCAKCPSLESCQVFARTHREHGFWGGESEEDRAVAGYAPPHPVGIPRLRKAG